MLHQENVAAARGRIIGWKGGEIRDIELVSAAKVRFIADEVQITADTEVAAMLAEKLVKKALSHMKAARPPIKTPGPSDLVFADIEMAVFIPCRTKEKIGVTSDKGS